MLTEWEKEVRHNQRMQAEGFTPYQEMLRWRRRFWIALMGAMLMAGTTLLLILARNP